MRVTRLMLPLVTINPDRAFLRQCCLSKELNRRGGDGPDACGGATRIDLPTAGGAGRDQAVEELPDLLYWSRIDCFDRAAINRGLAEYPTMGA
jgi:hypothetical protein